MCYQTLSDFLLDWQMAHHLQNPLFHEMGGSYNGSAWHFPHYFYFIPHYFYFIIITIVSGILILKWKRLLKADQNPLGLAQRGGRFQKNNNWGCLRHSSYQLVREGWQRTTACMKLPQAVSVLASWFEIPWSLLQSAEGCQGSMVRFAASGARINGS